MPHFYEALDDLDDRDEPPPCLCMTCRESYKLESSDAIDPHQYCSKYCEGAGERVEADS